LFWRRCHDHLTGPPLDPEDAWLTAPHHRRHACRAPCLLFGLLSRVRAHGPVALAHLRHPGCVAGTHLPFCLVCLPYLRPPLSLCVRMMGIAKCSCPQNLKPSPRPTPAPMPCNVLHSHDNNLHSPSLSCMGRPTSSSISPLYSAAVLRSAWDLRHLPLARRATVSSSAAAAIITVVHFSFCSKVSRCCP
jgi:hypothetical protein